MIGTDTRRRRHRPLGRRLVLAVLRSPLHVLLDPGLIELRYRGRRSGRRHALPVMYAPAGERMVVLAGNAPAKTWWRNFRTPVPVEVRHRGVLRPGVAKVLAAGDDGYAEAVEAYRKRHQLVPVPTDRLLVIDPSGGA